jgi:digeranylgeranylglycerophospholipid reductase
LLDVAVVGGGPAGSRVAYKLAEFGHQVTVFEKRNAIGEKPCCTGIISQECIRNFSIPRSVVQQEFCSARIFSPSGIDLRLYRPEIQASIVNRKSFDSNLASLAQSLGVTFCLNNIVERVTFCRNKVTLVLKSPDGCRSVEAQTVILATGFASPIVKDLGLGAVSYFVTGAQTEVEISGVNEVEVYLDQNIAPGYFAWLVPVSTTTGLVGLLSRKSAGHHLRNWLTILEAKKRITPGNYPIRYGGIPLKPLKKTYGERLLVLGDAAGQVKPTTGGGIYFGMICADIAAEILHNAIEAGDLSANYLSGYEREWRKKLGSELKREYIARRLYERLTNPQIERILAGIQSSGVIDSLLQDKLVSFDWHGGLFVKILKHSLKRLVGKGLKNGDH